MHKTKDTIYFKNHLVGRRFKLSKRHDDSRVFTIGKIYKSIQHNRDMSDITWIKDDGTQGLSRYPIRSIIGHVRETKGWILIEEEELSHRLFLV